MSNQNQLYTYAAVALIIGLIVGYFANDVINPPIQDEELLAQIEELQSELDDCEAQVASLQGEITDYEAQVASLQDTIADLEAQLEDQQNLEPVDGLNVPDTIPLVEGWYRGTNITYFDFGLNPRTAIPILVFFQEDSPDTAFTGQLNIIDAIPGQPGYSAFWRVYKVLAPSSYEANNITSLQSVLDSGYTVEETDIVVNCPVVNPDTTTEAISYNLTQGWYRGREVYYFDFGSNSGADGFVVDVAPIYAFFHMNDDPVAGQMNVIDVLPGDAGYSDLWQVHRVIVGTDYVANSLNNVDDILSAADMGDVTVEETGLLVNCPIVELVNGGNGGEPSNITITIEGTEFSFNPSSFTVSVNQTVEVIFNNVGTMMHNIRFGEWDVETPTISPGQTATITFTPTATGTFDYWCTVPGHRAQGMEGQITIEP